VIFGNFGGLAVDWFRDYPVTGEKMSDIQLDAQYEQLGKELGLYFDPNSRPLIDKAFEEQGYKVDRIFNDQGNTVEFPVLDAAFKFQALGLVSTDGSKPPVLVLPGGVATNPRSVGKEEFAANKDAIQDWLVNITNDSQANPQGIKPDVTGVSRGGSIAQLAASEFPALIGSVVTFVSTGIDEETANKFVKNGGDSNQVRHYITDGDYRSLWGEAFIPGTVTVGTYETPLAAEAGQVDYATRKHGSGILADLSSVFTDTNDPAVARIRAITDKPADLSLKEISVDELNQPDFTWQGNDWQTILEQLQTDNPNLSFFTNRESAEEARDVGASVLLDLLAPVAASKNPVPPEQVNQPTAGSDILLGTEDGDNISGLAGGDYIRGGCGDDVLFGNEGGDALIGNAGNDIINGGADNDVLFGGPGSDVFLFGDTIPFSKALLGVDRINDFTAGEDLIGLSKAAFTNLGEDFASVFSTVSDDMAARTSEALIVYNTSNGSLSYNANGNKAGFGDGGQFATLFEQPALSANDFVLV
jgi:serralysin